MSADLLVEVGAEEIPAGFLAKALVDLGDLAAERLRGARLEHGLLVTLGTPRRLALAVTGLADRQRDISEVVTGPPSKAAFDASGKPTKAALGFAQKMGVAVEALTVQEVAGKGAYVAARREERGTETRAILPGLLADLIRSVPWKKSMRWASLEEPFVRPVHWLVAIYGGDVVPLELYGVRSGRETRGHRFLAPGPIALSGAVDDYQKRLRAAYVIVDQAARRMHIEAALQEAGARPDPELLDEVTNLVEWPVAVKGEFDLSYLDLPREVIISAMRSHQRYFACGGAAGGLEPSFVTIAGTIVADKATVRHGNERVLSARLADARFFWQEDTKHSLDEHAKKLAGVVFQAKLGTLADKVARIRAATWPRHPKFKRAAELCKADLVTKMVGEFPELQGVMGRYHRQEDDEVAEAIFEHYLPRNAGDVLPKGDLGAEVGVADRMDTIVGCFAIGLAPTGSADAYGLRRAALAILNLLLARDWRTPLGVLVDDAAALYGAKLPFTPAIRAQVLEFFKTRLRGLLVERKLPADCVDAALEAGAEDVPDALQRATAVSHLRDRPDFEPLATAFKRIGNILKSVKAEPSAKDPDPSLLVEPSEKALWQAFGDVRARVAEKVRDQRYDAALGELSGLKPAVDRFFDDVLVMDKDPQVKANRLALLGAIDRTFLTIADFRQLTVE